MPEQGPRPEQEGLAEHENNKGRLRAKLAEWKERVAEKFSPEAITESVYEREGKLKEELAQAIERLDTAMNRLEGLGKEDKPLPPNEVLRPIHDISRLVRGLERAASTANELVDRVSGDGQTNRPYDKAKLAERGQLGTGIEELGQELSEEVEWEYEYRLTFKTGWPTNMPGIRSGNDVERVREYAAKAGEFRDFDVRSTGPEEPEKAAAA